MAAAEDQTDSTKYVPTAEFLATSRIDYVQVADDVTLEVQLFNAHVLDNSDSVVQSAKKNTGDEKEKDAKDAKAAKAKAAKSAVVTDIQTPLLFIHGYLDSRFSFLSTIESLFDNYGDIMANRLIIVPSLRGFGDSQIYPTDTSTFRVQEFASDMIAVLTHYNLSNAVWIGHSLGTYISHYTAAEDNNLSQYVESLILVGTGNRIPKDTAEYIVGSVKDATVPSREFIAEFQAGDALTEAYGKELADQVLRESFKVNINPYKKTALVVSVFNANDYLASVKVNTVIIWGSKDTVFPMSIQKEFQEKLTGCKSEFNVLKGASHNAQWEQPKEVADIIKKSILSK